MTLPTAAPTAEVQLGGEARTLKYGFRAYKEIGLNPFDPDSIRAFSEAKPTIDSLAGQIRAGLLHEYVKGGVREGQTPPTVEEVVDQLDSFNFLAIFEGIKKAMGVDGEKPEEQSEGSSENPPTA